MPVPNGIACSQAKLLVQESVPYEMDLLNLRADLQNRTLPSHPDRQTRSVIRSANLIALIF